MIRSTLLFTTTLIVTFAQTLRGQNASEPSPAPERAKPFEAFSNSALRLRDSIAARFGNLLQPESMEHESVLRDSLTAAARAQLGTRYRFGAEMPGKAFDCSGLVRFVLSALRIELPRTARTQALAGMPVERDTAQLKPGDLLTFGRGKVVTHVGIYVGDGRFIHASTTGRRVVESSIGPKANWYTKHWLGARRLVAAADTTS